MSGDARFPTPSQIGISYWGCHISRILFPLKVNLEVDVSLESRASQVFM